MCVSVQIYEPPITSSSSTNSISKVIEFAKVMQQLTKQQLQQQQQQHQQMQAMIQAISSSSQASLLTMAGTPSFAPFNSTAELWTDYWARFCTFTGAHSVPEDKQAQVFLTNQSGTVYKLLVKLAAQQTPPKDINKLAMKEIVVFMKDQFDSKRFVVREQFKFWSDMQRKPGETIQELAARIRQDAATCDSSSIENPQDEALRTRFICSVKNEAFLKALFKINELTFNRTIQLASEVDNAAKVAKKTVYDHPSTKQINKIHLDYKKLPSKQKIHSKSPDIRKEAVKCYRCDKAGDKAPACKLKNEVCLFCKRTGHLQVVGQQKQRQVKAGEVKHISKYALVKQATFEEAKLPKLEVPITIQGLECQVELAPAGILSPRTYRSSWVDRRCKT